jgi:L-fuconolactonase
MIIDAHQHYWRVDRGDYDWLTPGLGVLYRDFLPDDLAPHLERAGIVGTVLVQAAATEAETRYLAGLAATTPSVLGVVGWFDMEAPGPDARIAALRADCGPVLKGFRPMIQDLPDDDWVVGARLDAAFAAIETAGMAFDALVHPRHLVPLLGRLERNPGLRTVVDHCGKPDIAGGRFEDWAAGMRAIARTTGALCKLSGLLSQAGADQRVDALRPCVDLVLEEFGPRRMLWGSDWPVLTTCADYGRWLDDTRTLLSGLDDGDVASILGGNAVHFYDLPVTGGGRDTDSGEA